MKSSTLKEDILKESVKMIAEEGSENFSVRILSKKLNVSHNALYKHYKSKQEVLFAVAEVGYYRLGDIYIEISLREELTYIERLRECTYAYVEYVINNHNIYELMVNPHMVELEKSNRLIKSIQRTYGTLIQLAKKSYESKQCASNSPYSIVNTVWALGHGLASLIVNKQFDIKSDLDSEPVLLQDSKEKESNLNIRDMVRFPIESVFKGL